MPAQKLVTSTTPLDWNEVCRLAPALRMLEHQVRATPRQERDWHGWSRVKRMFSQLVGFESPNVLLRSPLAYDVVYDRLLEIWEGEA